MFQALLAGIGLATSAIGLFQQNEAADDQEKLNKQARSIQRQAELTSQKIADEQYRLSKKQNQISLKQENIRYQLFKAEAVRSRREIIRNTQIANATAVSRAAAGGGLYSSGFAGASAGITAQSNDQLFNLYGNVQAGRQNFALNRQLLNAQNKSSSVISGLNRTVAGLQSTYNDLQVQSNNAAGDAQIGGALFSTGMSLMGNAGNISNNVASIPGLLK